MLDYTAIADTSERLLGLLKSALVPDVLKSPNEIGLRSPAEHEDVSLGLCLYDIQESEELRQRRMLDTGVDRQTYPPIYLSLYYMITAYCESDIKFRQEQEERILGGVIGTFHNHSVLPSGGAVINGGMDMQIQLMRLPMEEKSRIWNYPGVPYRLSLFYKVSPVVMRSGKEKQVTRVREMDISVGPAFRPAGGR